MRHDQYCCFAIPLYGVGIYAILIQFIVLGLATGIVVLAAPNVLAIQVASGFVPVMGVLSIIVGVFSLIGLYGVYREKANLFRKFVVIHTCLVFVALVYALALIIMSSTRHDKAVSDCLASFLSNPTSTADEADKTLCNIWTWAQLGVCGLLWFVMASSEIYFCLKTRAWARAQRRDHSKYRSIVSAARSSIALRPSADWDPNSRSQSLDLRRHPQHDNDDGDGHDMSPDRDDDEDQSYPYSAYNSQNHNQNQNQRDLSAHASAYSIRRPTSTRPSSQVNGHQYRHVHTRSDSIPIVAKSLDPQPHLIPPSQSHSTTTAANSNTIAPPRPSRTSTFVTNDSGDLVKLPASSTSFISSSNPPGSKF